MIHLRSDTINELCLLLALPLLVGQLYGQPLGGAPAADPGSGAVAPKPEIRSSSPQTLLALGDGDQHLQTRVQERSAVFYDSNLVTEQVTSVGCVNFNGKVCPVADLGVAVELRP